VLLLHDLEGWKHREIGESLGMPEGTVRYHLFNARRAVRGRLRALVGEED
jgi:RNA polymerase sigma-70 factor (ECF subfamily)